MRRAPVMSRHHHYAYSTGVPYAVITREPAAAAPYAAALTPLGLDAIAMPVTRTAPPRDPSALPTAIAHGGYAAILVASARAAEALAAARGTAALPDVWAVGPATARALAAAGIAANAPPTARDGGSLAAALIAARSVAGQRILIPRAEDGRDEAISMLASAGAIVDAITTYRTIAADTNDPALAHGLGVLRRGEAAVCAVFAPSQVAALDALVGIRAITAAFAAIGETTASALRASGATVVGVAEAPTPERLANAVAAVYPLRP